MQYKVQASVEGALSWMRSKPTQRNYTLQHTSSLLNGINAHRNLY